MTELAGIIVGASCVWLIGLAVASAFAPRRAARFLSGFAATPAAHYLEQGLRILAGTGFVLFAGQMNYASFFRVFGWVLVVTSAALVLLPWQWHQRFAGFVVSLAIRHIRLYALAALLLAAWIMYGLFSPTA